MVGPSSSNGILSRASVLVVEGDAEAARHIVRALVDPAALARIDVEQTALRTDCTVVCTMAALRTVDLTSVDLVICRAKLPDATGVEVIAHLRTHHPDVPVILTSCFDGALSPAEAIRAGAIDFVLLDDAAFRTLPLAVAKCLEHQRIKRENDRLHAELSCSLAELEIKNRQFEAVIEHLELMTRTDGLTGLANRRWLDLRLEAVWAEATRCDHPMALMMIDLDDFKLVNDRLGHLHGDELLRLAARVLQANSRAMDTSARYGGDELCLVMPHIRLEDAINVARRITSEFAHAADSSDEAGMIGVGMSVGVAHIDASRPVNAMQLIRHADEALCAAKTNGKGQIMVRLGTAAVPDDEALVAVAPADERRSRT